MILYYKHGSYSQNNCVLSFCSWTHFSIARFFLFLILWPSAWIHWYFGILKMLFCLRRKRTHGGTDGQCTITSVSGVRAKAMAYVVINVHHCVISVLKTSSYARPSVARRLVSAPSWLLLTFSAHFQPKKTHTRDGRTDRRMDRRTDGRTDTPSHKSVGSRT